MTIIRLGNNIKWGIAVLALFTAPILWGQGFRYKSEIDRPDSTGFYRIKLHPQLVALTQNGYSDLRIEDVDGQEVPYWTDDEEREHATSNFTDYKIVSQNLLKDSVTVVVLHNPDRKRINNLSLFIRNADVQKSIRLTGSNDQAVWYSVKEFDVFRAVNSPTDVAEIKVVNFPLTDYEYLRLEIDDRHSSPVNLIRAGYYATSLAHGAYTSLNSSFVTADSVKDRTTWLTLDFGALTVVDMLRLNVLSPEFYMRTANMYYLDGDSLSGMRFLKVVTLSSDSKAHFNIESLKCRKLFFEVYNLDNPPLVVGSAGAFMLNRYCAARLQGGKSYSFKYGNEKIKAPRYDLPFFKSHIEKGGALMELECGMPLFIGPKADVVAPPFYANPLFVWIAILMVVALLGYLTWSMVREKR